MRLRGLDLSPPCWACRGGGGCGSNVLCSPGQETVRTRDKEAALGLALDKARWPSWRRKQQVGGPQKGTEDAVGSSSVSEASGPGHGPVHVGPLWEGVWNYVG